MDRYTSLPIANWLLTKNIMCAGTLQMRRVAIPEEIQPTKRGAVYSNKVFRTKEKGYPFITSYVVSSSLGMKNVLCFQQCIRCKVSQRIMESASQQCLSCMISPRAALARWIRALEVVHKNEVTKVNSRHLTLRSVHN